MKSIKCGKTTAEGFYPCRKWCPVGESKTRVYTPQQCVHYHHDEQKVFNNLLSLVRLKQPLLRLFGWLIADEGVIRRVLKNTKRADLDSLLLAMRKLREEKISLRGHFVATSANAHSDDELDASSSNSSIIPPSNSSDSTDDEPEPAVQPAVQPDVEPDGFPARLLDRKLLPGFSNKVPALQLTSSVPQDLLTAHAHSDDELDASSSNSSIIPPSNSSDSTDDEPEPAVQPAVQPDVEPDGFPARLLDRKLLPGFSNKVPALQLTSSVLQDLLTALRQGNYRPELHEQTQESSKVGRRGGVMEKTLPRHKRNQAVHEANRHKRYVLYASPCHG